MFTGIIEAVGTVQKTFQADGEWRFEIAVGDLNVSDVSLGDSIAVSGCCLTVVSKSSNSFSADVSNETMRCTVLGELSNGDPVNLEKAMRATDRFGGHIVSGHVDGVGNVTAIEPESKSLKITFRVPSSLSRFVAAKGSICIDGISLTVNEVNGNYFTVNVIPHTQLETVVKEYKVGRSANIEVDLIARYLERLFEGKGAENNKGVDLEFLKTNGYD
jgi:riboflavin synthase